MQPKTTLWQLDPHTKGKHLVLRRYLDAWLPIMSARNGRILFIDGFAGPGEYEAGEEGSPIIALRALCDHSAKSRISAEIGFIFIEKESDRAQHLSSLVSRWRPYLPSNSWVQVREGMFDETLTSTFNRLDSKQALLAPALVMVDPFGISGAPMDVIRRILSNPKSEVYISFMYDWINRFKGTPGFESHLDALYDCETWRAGMNIDDPSQRKDFFYTLYERCLRESGAKYVLRFELYEGGRLVYSIFFGTQDLKGCDRMKQAIWKIAPWGDFSFRGTDSRQLTMDIATSDFTALKQALQQRFRDGGWISIDKIEDFVASDKTDYHTGQLRKGSLIPMEQADEIEVESNRKRQYSYPPGTNIRFR